MAVGVVGTRYPRELVQSSNVVGGILLSSVRVSLFLMFQCEVCLQKYQDSAMSLCK